MKTYIKSALQKSGCIGFALLCASGLAARAGAPMPDSKDTKEIAPPTPENPWKFQLAAPSWLAASSGTVGLHGVDSHVYTSFDTLLRHLDMTASMSTEVRYQRFGFYGDFLYVDASNTIFTNGIVNKASAGISQWIADMELNYRALEGQWGWLDVRAGTRYTNIYTTLNIYPNDGVIDRASQRLVATGTSDLKGALQRDLRGLLNSKTATLPIPDLGADLQTKLESKIQTIAAGYRADVAAAIQAQAAARTAALSANIQSKVAAGMQAQAAAQAAALSPAVQAQLAQTTASLQAAQSRIAAATPRIQMDEAALAAAVIAQVDAKTAGLTRAQQAKLAAETSALQAAAQNRISVALQQAQAQQAQRAAALQVQVVTAVQAQADAKAAGLSADVQAKLAASTAALQAAQADLNAAISRVQAKEAGLPALVQARTAALIAAAQSAIDAAKKRASDRIADTLKKNLRRSFSLSESWWDPYVGIGGHYNINKTYYLAGKADIGGFSVGSQLTWQLYAGVGCNVTRNIFAELGYRYMYTNYNSDGFLYKMTQSGAQLTMGLNF